MSWKTNELANTLRAQMLSHPPVVVVKEKCMNDKDDISVTLRNRGGSYRGGRGTRYLLYQDTIGSLCSTDYKWVQQEQVMQGKLIVYESDKHNDEHLPGNKRGRNPSFASGE